MSLLDGSVPSAGLNTMVDRHKRAEDRSSRRQNNMVATSDRIINAMMAAAMY